MPVLNKGLAITFNHDKTDQRPESIKENSKKKEAVLQNANVEIKQVYEHKSWLY